MTNYELDVKFAALVKSERKITREILENICLAEHQRLPQELGFKDTYDWLIRGHGYSGSAANRRIQAARLLRAVPEFAARVEDGSLNLTTLWQTQKAIRSQQNSSGEKISVAAKREALEKVLGKTSEAAERELLAMFPQASLFTERIVQTRDGGIGMSVQFTEEEARELERAREILSHAIPGATMAQVIVRLAREFNQRRDPLRKVKRLDAPMTQDNLAATPRRAIARKVSTRQRRDIIQRAGGRCGYIDPISKRECGSRYQLEIDHIVPLAYGGTNHSSNLRCLCRKHNQWMAEREFGRELMDSRRIVGTRQSRPFCPE